MKPPFAKRLSRNPVDRAVEFFAPRAAVKRAHARAVLSMAGGYSGASKRMRSMFGFDPAEKSADEWLKYDRQKLINRSHQLTRDNSVVSGIINSNCTNIIGPGLALQSRVDGDFLGMDEEQTEMIETEIEREWSLWSESVECDISRKLNFNEMQDIVLREVFCSGASFVVFPYLERGNIPYGLKVQIIEIERICNEGRKPDVMREDGSSLYEGVEKDRYGSPVRYHICSDYPSARAKVKLKWTKIDAFDTGTGLPNVLHLFRTLRPGQTHGVPYLAPIIEPLYNLGKYSKAELDAAVVAACYTIFIKSESGDTVQQEGENIGNETGSKRSDDDFKLGTGAIIDLLPGEEIEQANPMRPNANFDPFFQSYMRQIGMALELPYETVIKHYQSSYSAAQAAFIEAWRFYKSRRKWIAEKFCQVVFTQFFYEAVARGRINAPGFFDDPRIRQAYLGSDWVGPSKGHMNPDQEASAVKTRTGMGLTTFEQETIEYNGGRFDRNIKQIARERKLLRAAGIIEDEEDTNTELLRQMKRRGNE